jgi:uncharacterized LabA/DUF88 family protein
MVFIDGGYLRKALRDLFGRDDFNFAGFSTELLVHQADWRSHWGEVQRTYFYDALISLSDDADMHAKQTAYFDRISMMEGCEVKLGTLVNGKDGLRQKGVDTLLAIDMVSKAYTNQYEVAILVSGDSDLEPVVRAVKETGKRVCGAFVTGSAAEHLVRQFDKRLELKRERLSKYLL